MSTFSKLPAARQGFGPRRSRRGFAAAVLIAIGSAVAQGVPAELPELRVLEVDELVELERPVAEVTVSERRGQVQVDGAQTVADASLAVGLFYAERGDLEQAFDVFRRGLERSADSRPLLYNTAVTALRLGRFEIAAEVAGRAVSRDPADGGLQHVLGAALAHLGRLQEARAALLRAAADGEHPNGAVAAKLGQVELRLGDAVAAVTALRTARSALAVSPAVAANLAVALAGQGDTAAALRLYEDGLASGARISELPSGVRAPAWRNLGILRQRAGRQEDALTAYAESLGLEPSQADLLVAVGGLHEEAERIEAALDAYRRAAELETPALDLVVRLGSLEARAGNREASIRWLSEALRGVEGEERLAVLLALANAHLESGDRDEAEAAFRQAIEVSPDSETARLSLGRLLRSAGRLDEAAVALEGPEQELPRSLAILVELAAVSGEAGDRDREETLYREILARSDDPAVILPVQVRLAVLLLRGGVTQDAESLLSSAMELAPSSSLLSAESVLRLRATHALLEARSGSRPSARRTLQAIVSEDPSFAPAVLASAVLELLDGETSRARDALSDLLPIVAGTALEPAVQGAWGQLLWLEGDAAGALAHLAAAAARFDWMSVKVALGGSAAAGERWNEVVASWREAEKLCGETGAGAPFAENRNAETWLWVEVGPSQAAHDELCREVAVAAGVARERHARLLASGGTSSLQAGELDAARQSLEQALAGGLPEAERGPASNNLGIALARLGRGGEARARLEEALRSPSVRIPATLNLAIVLDAAGDIEGARRLYREVAAAKGPRREEVLRWLDDLSGAVAGSTSTSATLVAHLPGAPLEAANRLAEAVTALGEALSQAASGLQVEVRLFRRWPDALAELERDPASVKLLLTDASALLSLPPEGTDFVPIYRFRRRGQDTFHRLLVVPDASAVASIEDLGGRSLSLVETSGPAATLAFVEKTTLGGRRSLAGTVGTLEWVLDDFSATANVLYGKTDAALVADYNPLLLGKLEEGELRSVFTSPPLSLPVLSVRRSAFDAVQLEAFERRLLGGDGDGPMARFLGALGLDSLRPVPSGNGPFDREALLGVPPSPGKTYEIVAIAPPPEGTVLEAPAVDALTFLLGVPLPDQD